METTKEYGASGDEGKSQEKAEEAQVQTSTPATLSEDSKSADLWQSTENPHYYGMASNQQRQPRQPETVQQQRQSPFEEDALLTPRIRDWSSTHTSGSLSPSNDGTEKKAVIAQSPSATAGAAPVPASPTTALKSEAEPSDYFPPAPPLSTLHSDAESSSTNDPSLPDKIVRPATSHGPERPRTSSLTPTSTATTAATTAVTATSGGKSDVAGKDSGNHEEEAKLTSSSSKATVSNSGSPRPTSVPNFESASLSSRRQDTPTEYPQYPNQSFAALQKHPAHPHPLRTRTSNPLHETSYTPSGSNASSSNNLSRISSGSRTVGSTPAQSPSLFSPTSGSVGGKKPASESEDGGYSTPMLHPTHLQAPKETHVLVKNTNPNTGRKHINQYELRERLGSGQHGTVKLAINLDTKEKVAVKIVRRVSKKVRLGRSGDPNDMIKKEVAILKKARHPHVVSLYEVVDDEEFAKVYLILEYVERGEIVWRKVTEKHIAVFEKSRLEREKAGFFDEPYENALVEEFNNQVSQRREEKARVHEENLREAKHQLETQRRGFGGNRSVISPYWSLEYGAESEHEYVGDSSPPRSHHGGSDTRLSRADLHAAESAAYINQYHHQHHQQQQQQQQQEVQQQRQPREESPTPMHTPRSHPYSNTSISTTFDLQQHQHQHLSSSQPGSRPDSPSVLEGGGLAYGAYGGGGGNVVGGGAYSDDGGQISDLDLQATLKEIIANQTQWSENEEEYRYVPCLTLDQALRAFRDTVLGVEYLHFQGIMHRDIKPANLLWTSDYRVKISDFGVSYLGKPLREDLTEDENMPEDKAAKINEDAELAKTVGTPAFYAPELCDPDFYSSSIKAAQRPAITGSIDVWALGVTLYGMIFGRLPFFDPNEFVMYEKIAQEEVFIPRMRLRGVEHTDKKQHPPKYDEKPNDKRFDDVLEYEEVEDTLRDLIKHLLIKDPTKRISLKEVKHHPWVIGGIEDREAWLDQNDPAVINQGKKIEPSSEEVQDAVAPLTIVDRVKMGVQRIGSVFRGRGSRKRTDSNPSKPLDSPGGGAAAAAATSSSSPSSSTRAVRDERRSSLTGNEAIFASLKASREPSDHHPLSQSVAASPEAATEKWTQYFDQKDDTIAATSHSAGGEAGRSSATNETLRSSRSSLVDHSLSTADSMRTIRAPTAHSPRDSVSAPATSVRDVFPTAASATIYDDPNHPHTITATDPMATSTTTTTLGSILNAPGRFMNTMRSRERGQGRSSPSHSSRASSVEPSSTTSSTREDLHASPSLAMSNAIAPGRVDQPSVLRDDSGGSSGGGGGTSARASRHPTLSSSNASSTEALGGSGGGLISPRRQTLAQSYSPIHRRSISHATGLGSAPSPSDEMLFFSGQQQQQQLQQQRPASVAESSFGGFSANVPAVSSSSDMIFSGDSAAHSRIPSVVSGASSISMPIATDEEARDSHARLEKSISPLKMPERSDSSIAVSHATATGMVSGSVDPSPAQAQKAEEEAAGYNGEPEEESDSEDEGLAMA